MSWDEAVARAAAERARQQERASRAGKRNGPKAAGKGAGSNHRGETWCGLCGAWVPRPHAHRVER